MAQIGLDENQPGASGTRASVSVPDAYFTAIVEDIIYTNKNGKQLQYSQDGSNLGEAIVRLIPSQLGIPLSELDSANPIDMNIQSFPIVGEQVIVFKVSGKLFYTRLAVRKRLTENTTPSIHMMFGDISISEETIRDSRELAAAGVPSNYTLDNASQFTSKFRVNPSTRPFRAYEGDMILQGRFGNAIRFGSSKFQNPDVIMPEPNLILTAGGWKTPRLLSTEKNTPYSLAEEDINEDRSSIWMVSDQQVNFDPITLINGSLSHLLTSNKKTQDFVGAQIFVNSDRVILNSKRNEISLFSNTEINLCSMLDISLNADQNIFLRSWKDIVVHGQRSLFLKAEDLTLIATKNLSIRTSGDNGLSGSRIFIGKYGDATQPMVLGRQLATFLSTLITNIALLNASVIGISTVLKSAPAGVGAAASIALAPSIDPGLLTVANQLAALLTGANPLGAIFNSRDNFVSKVNT